MKTVVLTSGLKTLSEKSMPDNNLRSVARKLFESKGRNYDKFIAKQLNNYDIMMEKVRNVAYKTERFYF